MTPDPLERYREIAKLLNGSSDTYNAWFKWIQTKIENTIDDNYKKAGSEKIAERATRDLLNTFLEIYG